MIHLRLEVGLLINGLFFFFSKGKETKEEEKLDFYPFSSVIKCAYGSAVCGWSPKACFNESSGIKYHLQRTWADMLDCDICFKVALRRRCQPWAAGLQDEQWRVTGQDETNDSNKTAAASWRPGWENSWTHSGMSPQEGAAVYPCLEKKRQAR